MKTELCDGKTKSTIQRLYQFLGHGWTKKLFNRSMEKLPRCAMILNTNLDIRFCVYILLYQPGIGTNGIIGIIGTSSTSSVWSVQALVSILTVLSVLAVLVLQPKIPLLIKTVVPI